MSETDTSPETSHPRISSEIIIEPDGRVTISFLTTELLDLAKSLNPSDPRFARLRPKLSSTEGSEAESEP